MSDTITATWQGNMHFISESQDGIVNLDAPKDFGGTEKGLRSKSLMLTSLAGCTGMDLGALFKKMRIVVDGMTIKATAELSENHPKIYKNTHVVYTFTGKDLNQEKIKKAVQLSIDTYCGVMEMFRSFSNVTTEIKFA